MTKKNYFLSADFQANPTDISWQKVVFFSHSKLCTWLLFLSWTAFSNFLAENSEWAQNLNGCFVVQYITLNIRFLVNIRFIIVLLKYLMLLQWEFSPWISMIWWRITFQIIWRNCRYLLFHFFFSTNFMVSV